MRACRVLAAGLVIAAAVAVLPPQAAASMRAAALVNGEAITMTDLRMRVRLSLLASNLPDTPEQRRRLRRRVLRSMINEKLRLQEAEKNNLTVEDEQVEERMRRIASQNQLSLEQFRATLLEEDIAPRIFREQVRASTAWQKLVAERIRPRAQVSGDEVDAAIDRLKAKEGDRQVRLRRIVLPLDGANAGEVQRTARRLVEQARQGTDFGALARQFSAAPTAAQGGDTGWITPETALPGPVAQRVGAMDAGDIAGPIRTKTALHIVQLTDTRQINVGTTEVQLKQLRVTTSGDRDTSAARELAATLRGRVDGCAGLEAAASGQAGVSAVDLGTLKMSDLPGNIASAVDSTEVGKTTAPLDLGDSVAVLAVCGRESRDIERDPIRRKLLRKRVNLMTQRYMRDLRSEATIDVRLDG